jgi:hypothetical protein
MDVIDALLHLARLGGFEPLKLLLITLFPAGSDGVTPSNISKSHLVVYPYIHRSDE